MTSMDDAWSTELGDDNREKPRKKFSQGRVPARDWRGEESTPDEHEEEGLRE